MNAAPKRAKAKAAAEAEEKVAAKSKATDDEVTETRVKAWAEAKDKENSDIARISDEAWEKAEAETRMRKRSNAARSVV